ncbi:adenylyl cyclase class-3/4/guanylyl cyclase [Micromonospora radicis]|uniref:Adenylyl cyclase class-3/4/guanylyl cyclase n=1 Tax=Micromonospora radicis TaxID=1894971 RepID=A0A418N0D3_9ACTN|nr:adenylyl cyclase class-3/4/guanylyl cyclase [Micromonospora radicis]
MPMSTAAARGTARRLRWSVPQERRIVTVLFVDIVGSTGLVDRLDPEDVRALQRIFFGTVARVLRRWDGAVEKYVGDAVMALFGARTGDGWEAYRAVRAALEIQGALDRRPLAAAPGLRVRVGVATGEAVVDLAVGHDGGYGVASGSVITLAARLQGYAPPGGVALCPATHRAVAGLIAQRRVPAVTVAGKSLPVDVWHATGTLRPGPPRSGGPLVGRRRELATARDRLAEAIHGRGPRRLLLVGAPGSGRSRLLHELARAVPTMDGEPVQWCATGCPPYPDGPLAPVADLLRALAGARATDSPEVVRRGLAATLAGQVPPECLAPALGTVAGLLGATGAAAGARAMVCWREVLLALARRRPVVLAVDDLDRAAPVLRRHLDALVDRATADGLPLVLVATAGGEDATPGHPAPGRPGPGVAGRDGTPGRPVARVWMRPLDAVTTGRLLRRLLRRAGRPTELVRQLVPLVGGNPGHAVAYVRALDGDDGTRPAVPESVRRLAEARLDRLDPPLRAALMAVATLPVGATTAATARALSWPVDRTASALRALSAAGLLGALPAGGYGITDPVLREVAGVRLPRALRAVFARRADTTPRTEPQVDTTPPVPVGRVGEIGAGSELRQEDPDPVPGELGGRRVVVGHGRIGEQVSHPGVAVDHQVGTGGGQLPPPLLDLVGQVVGVRIGQVQVDPQPGPDRRRAATGAVQQQQAGGVGALGEQRAGDPGAHREAGQDGLGRQFVEGRPGPVEYDLLADLVEQGEARLDGVDRRHPVQVGRGHLVPGGAQPIGGGQHGRPQSVDGVEECHVSHADILPDSCDDPGPARGAAARVPGGPAPARRGPVTARGRTAFARGGAAVAGRVSRAYRNRAPDPGPPAWGPARWPGAGFGCGPGTPRPPPRRPGSP